jgi:hypothetical protein
MPSASEVAYTIPLTYRRMENLHIVFWLWKDISWCMVWRPLGMLMILPTLAIALIIAWRTRHMVSELCHNLAIAAWIFANSYWMTAEFFHFDAGIVWGNVTYKHLALIPFGIGVLVLAYYYLVWSPRHAAETKTM